MSLKEVLVTGMMLLCIMSVSSCGKKPSAVDLPPEAVDTTYPHVYPDPALNL